MTVSHDPQAEQRRALLDQCRYLLDELTALEPLLQERVPGSLLEARPPNTWSIKEILGYLVDCDAHVFLPRLHQIIATDEPTFENIDQDALIEQHAWNTQPLASIIDQLQAARQATVDFMQVLLPEAWRRGGHWPDGHHRTVYDVALYMARHDAHHLRSIGYRLHESHITTRAVDLPK